MDCQDLTKRIREVFPLKKEEELKKARETFEAAAKKLLEENQQKNYFNLYGKSPYLYKFEPEKK